MQEPAAAETIIEEEVTETPEAPVDELAGEQETPETEAPETEGESDEESPAAEETKPDAERETRTPEELAAELKKAEARRFYLERQLAKKEAGAPQAETPPAQPPAEKPNADDFEDYEEYQDALMDWKIDQREAARAAQASKIKAEEKFKAFNTKMAKGAESHPDFVEVVTNPELTITPAMQSAIVECENSPDVAYYLGQNPQEAFDISGKDPIAAAIAIARIDQRISNEKPAQKTKTGAPKPTRPVSGDATAGKDLKDMSTDEWVKTRNAADGVE